MHAGDIGKYVGPPCKICQARQLVGTCTHRPRRLPKEVISQRVSNAMLKSWQRKRDRKAKGLE